MREKAEDTILKTEDILTSKMEFKKKIQHFSGKNKRNCKVNSNMKSYTEK